MLLPAFVVVCSSSSAQSVDFEGEYFSGQSNNETGAKHLELLDQARRLLSPADTEFQTVAGVYDATYFGLAEGAQ